MGTNYPVLNSLQDIEIRVLLNIEILVFFG